IQRVVHRLIEPHSGLCPVPWTVTCAPSFFLFPSVKKSARCDPAFMEKTISFIVNGQPRTVTTEPDRPLLEVLREDLQLTGTKYGCGEGQCRACTVLLDDKPVTSCRTPIQAA